MIIFVILVSLFFSSQFTRFSMGTPLVDARSGGTVAAAAAVTVAAAAAGGIEKSTRASL